MSPRKMLSLSFSVLSLSLMSETALAATNKNNCLAGEHDFCWSNITCNFPKGRLQKSYIRFGSPTWYGCESRAAASARNRAACNGWCDRQGDCDFCSTTLGCGTGALQKNSFGGYGDNYYACESRAAASARNKTACEGWCNARKDPAGAIYCDRCSTNNNCGIGSYEHAQWTGYGDNYHACEDYDAASTRNKANCESWCGANTECQDCYDTTLCGGISTSPIKDKNWGGGIGAKDIGDGWYACKKNGSINTIWNDYKDRSIFPTTKALVVILGGASGSSSNKEENSEDDGFEWFCEDYIFGKEIEKSVKCISSYGSIATDQKDLSRNIINLADAIERKAGEKPKIILVGKSMGGCKLQHALYKEDLKSYKIDTFFGVDTSCLPDKHWEDKDGLIFRSNVETLQNFYQTIDDHQTGYILAYENQYIGNNIDEDGVINDRDTSVSDYTFNLIESDNQVNVNTTGFDFSTMRKTEANLCENVDHASDNPIDRCQNLKNGILSYIERKVAE